MNLEVEINQYSGFCFGVVNAIQLAEDNLKNDNVFCLGQIVHNDAEMERLAEKGLVTINREELAKLNNKTVLFRAHGEPKLSYEIASKNNNKIIDASCPIILKLQERIKKSWEKGDNIVIFGKRNHPEVVALNSQTENSSIIIEKVADVKDQVFPKRIALYSQTTMEQENYYQVLAEIKEKGVQVDFNDTICRQVSNRKQKMIDFAKKFDIIIFVAGKNSSNGKVLFNICKKANNNTIFISSSRELDKDWFKENDKVGICGATSTPKWQMEKVKTIIESW